MFSFLNLKPKIIEDYSLNYFCKENLGLEVEPLYFEYIAGIKNPETYLILVDNNILDKYLPYNSNICFGDIVSFPLLDDFIELRLIGIEYDIELEYKYFILERDDRYTRVSIEYFLDK